MRKLALVLSVAFLLAGCNRASESDVDEGISLWNELWDGYFKALDDNKADPDKMVAAGQKFLDDNQDRISKINTIFNKKGTDSQINKVKRAVEDSVKRIGTKTEEIVTAMSKLEGMTPDKLQEVATKIDAQMSSLNDQIMK